MVILSLSLTDSLPQRFPRVFIPHIREGVGGIKRDNIERPAPAAAAEGTPEPSRLCNTHLRGLEGDLPPCGGHSRRPTITHASGTVRYERCESATLSPAQLRGAERRGWMVSLGHWGRMRATKRRTRLLRIDASTPCVAVRVALQPVKCLVSRMEQPAQAFAGLAV